MKTLNELKRTTGSNLRVVINSDTDQTKVDRVKELNASYLERHPEMETIPDFIQSCNEEMAVHFTLGSLQASLWLAISELQTAEAALEEQKV